jgi:phospho-N-acetylmuramoyl-pentapeptide-transferase
MLYYLIDYLEQLYQPPGFQVIRFLTVRAALGAITALLIALFAGKRIILWLQKNQFGERVRTVEEAAGLDHSHKAGTPTMGGTIMLLAVLGATLLWADIFNTYVWLAWVATAWMGAVGFADDYIKVVKKNKDGLPAKAKLAAQLGIGLVVGGVLYFHPDFVEFHNTTYLPFIKSETFNYFFWRDLAGIGPDGPDLGWVLYIPMAVFVMMAVSNAVNLTDGLDGLAAGTTAFVAIGLTVLAYISGNVIWAGFLGEQFIPGTGELVVFTVALASACFGFLWYNGYPAQVFMGDTGSLALGAAVATVMLAVRKELLIPFFCLIFFLEALSVIAQTLYFKWTRKRTGEGKRLLLMAPLHHHYEKSGVPENKIVLRFWIITAIMVIAALLTLRIR